MAFILHTSQSVSHAKIHTFSLRKLVISGSVLVALIFSMAFGLGWFLGVQQGVSGASSLASATDPLKERFSFDKLGGVSGRLLALESEARSLVKKLTALEMLETRLTELQSGKKITREVAGSKPVAAGGKVFAPQPCETGVAAHESTKAQIASAEMALSCLQGVLKKVEQAVSQRSVAYMVLPTKSPLIAKRLGSSFGNRVDPFTGRVAFHSGLDFEAQTGAPVLAAGAGKVIRAGWVSDLGYMVEIDHGNGLVTRYAHSSKLHVKPGDLVTPGQKIAEVGSTGRSTGPHLHFEILHGGKYVDPSSYLDIGNSVPNV